MAATYKSQIMSWAWHRIVDDTHIGAAEHLDSDRDDCSDACDDEGHAAASYLGTVMSLAPSGKYYLPWTTNQTARDVDQDSRWYAALDQVADKFGGWIESGKGDPTDLYFMRYWPNSELA